MQPDTGISPVPERGIKTELAEGAVGLPGVLMQAIATIAPSFAILASYVFITTFAGVVTPWAYLFGGVLLASHGRRTRKSSGGSQAFARALYYSAG